MVTGTDGASVNNLSIQEPTMPAHGHGTEPKYSEATPTDKDGLYELKDMNLYMDGMWSVLIRISSQDEVEDEVAFHFELERDMCDSLVARVRVRETFGPLD